MVFRIRSRFKILLFSFFSRLKMFLINSPDIQILRKYFQIFLLGGENIQSNSLVIFSSLLKFVFHSQPVGAVRLIGCLSDAERREL